MAVNLRKYMSLSLLRDLHQAAADLEAEVDCQHVWGARPGHRDELILRDRATGAGTSSSSDESLDERLWCLMDYYDPTAIVNTEGEVVERYRFSAFGLRAILDPDFDPRAASLYDWDFAFKGQFLDLESGYYNYGYRYYSPQLGRWLSRDPIGEAGGVNLYELISNNPVNILDYLGLKRTSYRICVVGRHVNHPVNASGCDKVYYAECFASPNGGYVWPTPEDKKAALANGDPRAREDDATLGAELARMLFMAEDEAQDPDRCTEDCTQISIKVILEFSASMMAAYNDPVVREAEIYKNRYDCKSGKFDKEVFRYRLAPAGPN
jgi:RHS repeat-associated protein